MSAASSSPALDQLFRAARTPNVWTERSVSDNQLRDLYELVKWGPTSANCCPARFVWVKTQAGKSALSTMASSGNQQKLLGAPVTVIIGHDYRFSEQMPKLFPARATAMQSLFAAQSLAESTAFRNGSLQGAYLILAARALGLDAGPLSGFDHDAVDRCFFAGTSVRANFLCCLGYGSGAGLFSRNPRLSFDEAGRFA